jgi:hypothetical protein
MRKLIQSALGPPFAVWLPLMLGLPISAWAQDGAPLVLPDAVADAAPRRTDPSADGPYDAVLHPPIDLREVHIGTWLPLAPEDDLFAGSFSLDGAFVRLDVILDGLVNPPGMIEGDNFDPFQFGNHPVFGLVEIDMDGNVQTGGELALPCYHYLANVARFGGKPSRPDFQDRVALDASPCDPLEPELGFYVPPYVKRHGEEFHLALLDEEVEEDDIEHVLGNGNQIFEAGEIWNLEGRFFHRAHGYEPFSLAHGGQGYGDYMPACTLQFRHDAVANVTWISLVFPLTNMGAALMMGEPLPPQPMDSNPSNQASVAEALTDLQDSAQAIAGQNLPQQAIIDSWSFEDPTAYLDPNQWKLTALFGTSYSQPDPSGYYYLVWTDVYPNPLRGDVNGDNASNESDRQQIQAYIAQHDADDGQVDEAVVVPNFGPNFSILDIDQNGIIDGIDVLLVSAPGDLDDDGHVDLRDYSYFLNCFSGSNLPYADPACALADLNLDGDADLEDAGRLISGLTGPAG